jgi:hypothetical protein
MLKIQAHRPVLLHGVVSDEALVRGLLALIPRGVVKGVWMKLHAIKVLQGDLLLASLRVPAGLGGLGCALLHLIDHLLLISLEGVSSKLEVFLITFKG